MAAYAADVAAYAADVAAIDPAGAEEAAAAKAARKAAKEAADAEAEAKKRRVFGSGSSCATLAHQW